ncbi:MAG: DUF4873 domain-containing protein [Mycobacterium sp.]|nr:DUF4873 domain-containing protein [Mycobacterium sp.]
MSAIVIGARRPLGLELADFTLLPDRAEAHFDTATETWTVTASDGTTANAMVVVDTRPSSNAVVASHGVPNYFRIPGPDVRRQARYVTRCLQLIERSGAARMEARGDVAVHRWRPQSVESRFYLTGVQPAPDGLYDGPATVTVAGESFTSRVRLVGHLDAIDGRYHWQGMVFDPLPDAARGRAAGVTLTIEDRTAVARVVELTPWGTHTIAGVGDPPFA